MVQVDVFWAYGFGASLAVAAGNRLVREQKPLESRYFVWTLLFLALCWAPTGMLLLIRHPSWETMQVAADFPAINEFLVLGFGITNVTQGILGFWTGYLLLRSGRHHLANLNWLLGYFGMFFILVYGWDGLGYDRFFYDRDMVAGAPAWTPGAGTGETLASFLAAVVSFLTSKVAFTLYLDGLYLLPPFMVLMFRWHRDSLEDTGNPVSFWRDGPVWLLSYLAGVFVVALGAAIFSALVVNGVGALLGVGDHVARAQGLVPAATGAHVLSYVLGLPLALGVLWLLALRRDGVVNRVLAPWCLDRAASTPGQARLQRA